LGVAYVKIFRESFFPNLFVVLGDPTRKCYGIKERVVNKESDEVMKTVLIKED
jgi:hypothetical protein